MPNGKWQMANAKWQMANGKWQMANAKLTLLLEPAVHSARGPSPTAGQ
jgi:hypothetical protein